VAAEADHLLVDIGEREATCARQCQSEVAQSSGQMSMVKAYMQLEVFTSLSAREVLRQIFVTNV
jgi:hypothetical protein